MIALFLAYQKWIKYKKRENENIKQLNT